jgi:uncharacterized membrane protein
MRDLWIFLHLIGVAVWIGGMSFAHFCLRPAAMQWPPPQRLPLMADALGRFFGQVGAAIAVLWVSGIAMMLQTGFGQAPGSWHAMMGVALVMTVVFAVIRLQRYPRLRRAISGADWPSAGAALNGIRVLVTVNLGLGLLTIAIATLGRMI